MHSIHVRHTSTRFNTGKCKPLCGHTFKDTCFITGCQNFPAYTPMSISISTSDDAFTQVTHLTHVHVHTCTISSMQQLIHTNLHELTGVWTNPCAHTCKTKAHQRHTCDAVEHIHTNTRAQNTHIHRSPRKNPCTRTQTLKRAHTHKTRVRTHPHRTTQALAHTGTRTNTHHTGTRALTSITAAHTSTHNHSPRANTDRHTRTQTRTPPPRQTSHARTAGPGTRAQPFTRRNAAPLLPPPPHTWDNTPAPTHARASARPRTAGRACPPPPQAPRSGGTAQLARCLGGPRRAPSGVRGPQAWAAPLPQLPPVPLPAQRPRPRAAARPRRPAGGARALLAEPRPRRPRSSPGPARPGPLGAPARRALAPARRARGPLSCAQGEPGCASRSPAPGL